MSQILSVSKLDAAVCHPFFFTLYHSMKLDLVYLKSSCLLYGRHSQVCVCETSPRFHLRPEVCSSDLLLIGKRANQIRSIGVNLPAQTEYVKTVAHTRTTYFTLLCTNEGVPL